MAWYAAQMQMEVERRMRDIGRKLPDAAGELLMLIEETETWLSRVHQSPPKSMYSTLRPTMSALIKKELLDHTDSDVKLAVISCLTEVTRITAPKAPYDDDVMRDVFTRVVDAFGKLDDTKSPTFARRDSVLETFAKVRSCVLMLDLDCDDLIRDTFHHFFRTISPTHQENVISSMETIMMFVIEESELVHPDLASCLLQNVKKGKKESLPQSFGLAEKVIGLCSKKLKPVFIQLLQGTPLNEYSEVVTSLLQDSSDAGGDNNIDAFGKDTEILSPKSLTKMGKTKGQPGYSGGSKRKHVQEAEEAPQSKKNKALDGSLVGSRIKVWWSDDKKFYDGVVKSFDASSKKHKIVHDDGYVEKLLLKDEKWEFIVEEKSNNPDTASDIPPSSWLPRSPCCLSSPKLPKFLHFSRTQLPPFFPKLLPFFPPSSAPPRRRFSPTPNHRSLLGEGCRAAWGKTMAQEEESVAGKTWRGKKCRRLLCRWSPAQEKVPPPPPQSLGGLSFTDLSPQLGGMNPRPPGGFTNFIQSQQFPPFPQQPHPENFHFVGVPAHYAPFSPPPAQGSPSMAMPDSGIPRSVPQQSAQDCIDLDNEGDAEPARTDRRLAWTREEDIRLVSAWLSSSKASNDSINGNCKKTDHYWSQVVAVYNSTTPSNRRREVNQLKIRWHRISTQINHFNGCWMSLKAVYASGMSNDQLTDNALVKYENQYSKPFTFTHSWRALRDQPKWHAYCEMLNKEKNSSSLENVVDVKDLPRPEGNKAAKANRNGNRKVPEPIAVMGEELDKFIEAQSAAREDRNGMIDFQQRISSEKLEAAKLAHLTAKEKKECKMIDTYKELLLADTTGLNDDAKAEHAMALKCMRLRLFGTDN